MNTKTLHLTLFGLLLVVNVAQNAAGQDRSVRTAQELQKIRNYHDETTWAKEVLAQRYESVFVKLWDSLLQHEDKFEVFRKFPFDEIQVGTQATDQELEWGIERRTFTAPRKLNRKAALQLLTKFEQAGYRVLETEWHHSAFTPPTSTTAARSTVSIVLHIARPESARRIIVRGNLEIGWAKSETPRVSTIDASNIRMLIRDGDPGFTVERVLEFDVAPQTSQVRSIHPLLVHDLNHDGLPEIVIGPSNEVYWNKGNWEFDKRPLCKYPTRFVRAAVFADFTGDGVDDYLCFPVQRPPLLYQGAGKGEFPWPARPTGIRTRMEKPSHVTVGDIDGDGDLDAFMGQQKPSYSSGFIPTPYYDANDGYPFILMLNDGKGRFQDGTLLAGLGAKRYRHVFSSTFVDLDGDDDLDLLLTNDFCGCDYFLNDGQGQFTDARDSLKPTPHAFGMSHSFGDYDLDGKLDVIAIGMSSTTARRLEQMELYREGFDDYDAKRPAMGYGNRLFLNQGSQLVQAPFNNSVARTGWSWGSTTFDFDRDGDQDIYIGNGQTSGKTTKDYCTRFWCHDLYYKPGERPDNAVGQLFKQFAPLFSGEMVSWNGYEHNALLMNQAGKGFLNVGFLMGVGFEFDARTVVSADLDQDGRVDLLVEHKDLRGKKRNLHIVRNQWQDQHHWIGVHLIGGSTNSPHGAKVSVTQSNGVTLTQHCLSGHSVWAQHPHSLHFGTGNQLPKEITITWPGGKETKMSIETPDQYVRISPSF